MQMGSVYGASGSRQWKPWFVCFATTQGSQATGSVSARWWVVIIFHRLVMGHGVISYWVCEPNSKQRKHITAWTGNGPQTLNQTAPNIHPSRLQAIYNLCEVLSRKLSNCIIMWRREQSFMVSAICLYACYWPPVILAWHLMSLNLIHCCWKWCSPNLQKWNCPVAAQVDE